jgi:hypothetical protein
MAQETGFSHILIGEDEEETVIEAGYVAQKEQKIQESFDDVAQQQSQEYAPYEDDGEEALQPEERAFYDDIEDDKPQLQTQLQDNKEQTQYSSEQEPQQKQPSRTQELSPKKKVYTGEEPMPVAQKIVIIAAVLLIVVAIVYYAFFR